MPHVEVNYTNDLNIDFNALFVAIETAINQLDASAGDCKSRAYPCITYRHSHILITVSFLKKPHRDDDFTKKMTQTLELTIKKHLPQPCYFSLLVEYNPLQYVTNRHNP